MATVRHAFSHKGGEAHLRQYSFKASACGDASRGALGPGGGHVSCYYIRLHRATACAKEEGRACASIPDACRFIPRVMLVQVLLSVKVPTLETGEESLRLLQS